MLFNKQQNERCQHLSVNTDTRRPLADLSCALPTHRGTLQILSYVCPDLIYLYNPDSTKRGEKRPQTQRIHSSSLFPVAHTQPTHFLSQQRNWALVMQCFHNKEKFCSATKPSPQCWRKCARCPCHMQEGESLRD